MKTISLRQQIIAGIPRSPIIHVLGSILQLGSQTTQVVMIGHLLGASVVGAFGYCLALITPLALLANWHVRHARILDAGGEFTWEAYARLRGRSFLAMTPVLALGVFLPALAGFVGLYLTLALLRLTEMWLDLFYSAHQRAGEIGRIGIGVGLRSFVSIAAFAAIFLSSNDLILGLLAQTFVSLCWWYLIERPTLVRERNEAEDPPQGEGSSLVLLRKIWPLGITVALGSLVSVFPRIALVEQYSLEEAGRFILLGYLFIPAILMQTAMQQAAIPRLADAVRAKDSGAFVGGLMRLTLLQIVMLIAVAAVAMVIQSSMGLKWISPGFSVTSRELSWFLFGQCAGTLINSSGLAMDTLGWYRAKLLYWCTLTALGMATSWWMATNGISGVGMAAALVGLPGGIAGIWVLRLIYLRQDVVRAT